MPPTYTTAVPTWIPDVISAAMYDTMYDSALTLSALATPYGDLEGRPGEAFTIPTLGATTPADNLGETVPAVDDQLTGSGVVVTIKEAVKSIAWSDRTRVQTGQDVNAIAGGRVGQAINDRVELDLGAALVAGRDTTKDSTVAALTVAALRGLRRRMPAKLRRRGRTVILGTDDALSALFDDPDFTTVAAQTQDSDSLQRGEFTRNLYGLTLVTVDDGVIPPLTNGGPPVVVACATGMLVRAFQRRPQTETERDARARLSRIVGTVYHGEGVVDTRGVIAMEVTG